ncbi:MAG: FliM/FliN family flagellar motor switch protein [Deltaproteobacteria bacterium]|nr:FliM/FliN family flagellar motor switch protein [Deltaproteobacteria bacterium]
MNHAWAEIYPIHTHFIRSETNALAVNVVHATEFLVSAKMELEFNKPIGHIIVCLPYASIQPIREKLSGGFQEEGEDVDKVWVARLKKELSRVPVVITVDLGYTHLPVREFLNMKEGDILIFPSFLEWQESTTIGRSSRFRSCFPQRLGKGHEGFQSEWWDRLFNMYKRVR